jgi:hypothetical protein
MTDASYRPVVLKLIEQGREHGLATFDEVDNVLPEVALHWLATAGIDRGEGDEPVPAN